MSRTKPLSIEEKIKRMLELLQEKNDFFNQKEIEKMALKEKGIVTQSAREVLDILVSDGLAKTEKIGSSNYFWSFKSDARIKHENKMRDLAEELSKLESAEADLEDKLEKSRREREGDLERESKLALLTKLEREVGDLEKELSMYKSNDPEEISRLREETKKLVSLANQWTENIFILQGFLVSKYSMDGAEVNKGLSIPEDLAELSD